MTFQLLNSSFLTNNYTGLNFYGLGTSFGSFTNCYGDIEYEKLAGYSVASSIMSIGLQALQSTVGSKEPKVDYNNELKNINSQIDEQLDKLPGATEDNYYGYQVEPEYDEDIASAKTNIENAKASIASYEETIKTIGAKPEAEMTAAEKAQFEEAKTKKAELEESIAEGGKLNEALKQAEEAKEARQDEINEIISKIDELLDERDRINATSDMSVLEKADGNRLTRAKKSCMTETYDANNQASKADIRRAFNEFIKAKDSEGKRAAANKILEMADSNPKLEDKYSQELDIINNWLENN